MKITVKFVDGNIRQYKSLESTTGTWDKPPFSPDTPLCGQLANLHLDKLDEGIWLDYLYFTAGKDLQRSITLNGEKAQAARLDNGVYISIVRADELEKLLSVRVDEAEVIRRIDGELVNLAVLDSMSGIFVDTSDEVLDKIYELYIPLHDGGELDESIASSLGISHELLAKAVARGIEGLSSTVGDSENATNTSEPQTAAQEDDGEQVRDDSENSQENSQETGSDPDEFFGDLTAETGDLEALDELSL